LQSAYINQARLSPANCHARIRNPDGSSAPRAPIQRILVRGLADKVPVLHYSRELAYGLADTVLSDPRVIEAYIGKR
jgi:hypothetical protein